MEFAGYYGGYTGEELKALLDEIGLKSVSVHQGIDMFLKEGQAAFDFFKAYGIRYIVIPWYDKNLLAGTEAWNSTKESFKKDLRYGKRKRNGASSITITTLSSLKSERNIYTILCSASLTDM